MAFNGYTTFILVSIDDIAKIGSSKEGSNISDTSKIYYMGDTVNLGDFFSDIRKLSN